MVIEISNEKILEVFKSASKDIRVILSSEIVKDEILSLIEEYNPSLQKKELFFKEITKVALELSQKRELIERVENIFSVSALKATKIVSGLDNILFKRIRKVQSGVSSDYLNIDNNVDHFSNNIENELDVSKEIIDNIDENLDYNSYVFKRAENKNI